MTPTEGSRVDPLLGAWSKLVLDPASRTYWGSLLAAALIAAALAAWIHLRGSQRPLGTRGGGWKAYVGPSARVDYLLIALKPLFFVFWALPWALTTQGIAVGLVRRADRIFGRPEAIDFDPIGGAIVYTLVLFLAWDLSRFILHWAMHRFDTLWQIHQVHHSAETLTPFTLYRVHPIESALYQARGVLVSAAVTALFFYFFRGSAFELQLLGVNALGFGFSALGGNLRHSHTFWSWGPTLERWFISPAQHQLHHARTQAKGQINYGTWLAVWDRMARSLQIADQGAPDSFGLEEQDRNHDPHSALSALLAPVVAMGRTLLPRRASARLGLGLGIGLGCFLLPGVARAQTPASGETPAPEPATKKAPNAADTPTAVSDEGGKDQEASPKEGEKEGGKKGYERDVTVLGKDLPRVEGSAHVVDEEALERSENDDITRELRVVPGVYVRGEDGFGLRPNIGLRGVDSNRSSKVTLMEDGVLLGPAPYAAPAAYYFPLSTRMTGIEVFKGPAAVRHGPNTIGGAINLLTREIPWDTAGGVDLALGQRGYGKAHVFGGHSWEHFGILVEGARLGSSGFKELDGGGDTGFTKNEGMIKLRANVDPAARVYQQFDLKGGFSTERSNETYLGITDADFAETPYRRYVSSGLGLMQWWRSQAELSYSLRYRDLVEFQSTAYRHDFSRSWRKFNRFAGGPEIYDIMADTGSGQAAIYLAILKGEENSADPDQTLLIGTNDRSYVSQGIQNTLRISPKTKFVDQNIEFGVRFHHDTVRREHTEDGYQMLNASLVPDGADTQTTTLNRGTAYAGSIHLYDRIKIVDRFTVSPGARVELIRTEFQNFMAASNPDAFNAVFVPGIGAHVSATKWLGFLAGVHSGFSPVAPGQPDEVKPERSINYEGGFRLHGPDLKGFHGEAIGFYTDYSNLTGECTFAQGCDDASVGNQFNAGEVRVAGAEVAGGYLRRIKQRGWIDTAANYTFTWSQFRSSFTSASPQFGDVEAGDALPYLPVHVASLKLAGGMDRWNLWATLAYNGEMRDTPGQGEVPEPERIPHFLTLDVGARVWVTKAASLYLNVMNATGAQYIVSRRPVGIRPGRPRFASLGFKYDFTL